jgi:hypothetical protein
VPTVYNAVRLNLVDQALDIAGSLSQNSTMTLINEPAGIGLPLTGQAGSGATVASINAGDVTITGLTGMTADSVGHFLGISGATNTTNDGYFLIDGYNSATSVNIVNTNAVLGDSFAWCECYSYSLLADLNYERTDRTLIKGVPYYDPIPTYQRPTAIGTNVPANLSNIAGCTTDAVAYCVNRAFYGVQVNPGDLKETITATGMLKHADAVDQTGIPCFDSGPFAGDWNSCYVHVVDGYQEGIEFSVLAGVHQGERIFGITYAGATGTSKDSVEVHFYSAPWQLNYATNATPYEWESGQDGYANFLYGYNERLDSMDKNALRTVPTLGILVDAQMESQINNIIETIGSFDGYTSLAGLLTNLGEYYPFYHLNTATPTVVDALNILNQQDGDNTFTGNIYGGGTLLEDGYTTTYNLNVLGANLGVNTNYTEGSFNTGTLLVDGYSITQLLQLLGSNIGDNTNYSGGNVSDGYSITQSIQYFNQTIGYYGNFTGSVLNDGYSISQNLQQLANSITTSTTTRYIDRITGGDVSANTPRTLPGGATYTLDGTGNGANLFVYTRGLLRDPGPVSGSNDYTETSTTSVTFYTKLKNGDHINYFIK